MPACLVGPVQFDQLTDDDIEGPAIADDVVHAENEEMVLRSDSIESCPEEGRLGQVEFEAGLGDRPRCRLPGGIRRTEKILKPEEMVGGLLDELTRLTVDLDESGPQGLVALHQFDQSSLQDLGGEVTPQTRHRSDVIRCPADIHSVDDPEPALGVGYGVVFGVGDRVNPECNLLVPATNQIRELAHRRHLEDFPDVQLDTQIPENAPGEHDGLHAVATKVEEPILGADAGDAQDIPPDRAELFLDVTCRANKGIRWARRVCGGIGEVPSVQLATGGSGYLIEPDEVRRNHVIRQPLAEESAQS